MAYVALQQFLVAPAAQKWALGVPKSEAARYIPKEYAFATTDISLFGGSDYDRIFRGGKEHFVFLRHSQYRTSPLVQHIEIQ